MSDEAASLGRERGLIPALAWACYLGSSWTWVIGMFFPILLLRDFGLWGWVAFAVPNVLGAMAMGFVLTPSGSWRVTREHGLACRMFAEVTVAFHGYVAAWAVAHLFGFEGLLLAVIAAGAFGVVCMLGDRWAVGLGVAVTLASAACAIGLLRLPELSTSIEATLRDERAYLRPTEDLIYFIPVAVTGFLLCPYLDPTFHRARQVTGKVTGWFAFALGFGVIFLGMIVMALLYGGDARLQALFATWPGERSQGSLFAGAFTVLLGLHICVQVAFTVATHATVPLPDHPRRLLRPLAAAVAGVVLAAVLIVLGRGDVFPFVIDPQSTTLGVFRDPYSSVGIRLTEIGYRAFLVFYGLVFPAYVFIVMLPMRVPAAQSIRIALWIVATLIALPFGVAGFVYGYSRWMLVALGVLVIARIILDIALAPDEEPDKSQQRSVSSYY